MALVAWQSHAFLQQRMGHGHLAAAVEVIGAGALALGVFLAAAILLRSEETRDLRGLLRRR
jgi:hypothetical protein